MGDQLMNVLSRKFYNPSIIMDINSRFMVYSPHRQTICGLAAVGSLRPPPTLPARKRGNLRRTSCGKPRRLLCQPPKLDRPWNDLALARLHD